MKILIMCLKLNKNFFFENNKERRKEPNPFFFLKMETVLKKSFLDFRFIQKDQKKIVFVIEQNRYKLDHFDFQHDSEFTFLITKNLS